MLSYRDIAKWGDKTERAPEPGMKKLLLEFFGKEKDQTNKEIPGDQQIILASPCNINPLVKRAIEEICGAENVSTLDADRALHAFGKFYGELLLLRNGKIKNTPDMVVFPRNSEEVEKIITICHQNATPIVPFGGGSSVTGALQMPNGGICVDLTRHLNKIIEINEINQTVTVEAGILGPKLEHELNNHKLGYTCGHFPQSFEFSTPGGWIAARGAGTFSTGYGKIEDILVSMKVVCPSGIVETKDFPASAEGIDLNRIFLGSEGVFGIITEATLKIRKFRPQKTVFASFIFRSFESAVESMRQSMQDGYGKPHLYRISDPTETEIAFRLKEFNNTFKDSILKTLGYRPNKRVIMFAAIEGMYGYPEFIKRKLKMTAKKFKGLYIGDKPSRMWLDQRYSSAYSRDPLMDMGLIADTIETAVTWQNLIPLWKAIVHYLNSRPKTLCMVHISHVYENGANLYVTYISPLAKTNEIDDFEKLHSGLVEVIISNKGSLSHHHGIGRVLSPWMKKQFKSNELAIIRALKKEFDPHNIMNPGNMLGLD